MNEFIRIAFLWLSCECFLILQRSPFLFCVFKKFSLVKPTLCSFLFTSRNVSLCGNIAKSFFFLKKIESEIIRPENLTY